MSAFWEQAERDVVREFLDEDVFGEPHEIDGKTIICMPDEDVLSRSDDAKDLGLYMTGLVLFVHESDLPRGHEGDPMVLDGVPRTVLDWRVDRGMHRIRLSAPDSY